MLIMFIIQASRLVREPWVFWRHLFSPVLCFLI